MKYAEEEKQYPSNIQEEIPVAGAPRKSNSLVIISGIIGALISSFIIFTLYNLIGHDKLTDEDCFLDLKWHIFYTIFLGLLIGFFISFGVKKSRNTNTKIIFTVTVLCIIFAYLTFNFAIYIKYYSYNPLYFPAQLLSSCRFQPLRFYLPGVSSGIHVGKDWDREMYKYTYYIMRFCKFFTQGRLEKWTQSPEEWRLAEIINLQVWVIQFLITYICSWKLINFICPWLSPEEDVTRRKTD